MTCVSSKLRGYALSSPSIKLERPLWISDIACIVTCPYKFYLRFCGFRFMDNIAILYGKLLHRVRQLVALSDLESPFSSIRERKDFLTSKLASILEQAYSELNVSKGSFKIPSYILRNIIKLQGSLPKPSFVEVEVRIEVDLGLVGIIDLVINGAPFELKVSSPSKEDEVQLTWYVLLLERKFNEPIDMGYIEYLNKGIRRIIYVDDDLRLKALKCWKKALEFIYVPPSLTRSTYCRRCIYKSLCSLLL